MWSINTKVSLKTFLKPRPPITWSTLIFDRHHFRDARVCVCLLLVQRFITGLYLTRDKQFCFFLKHHDV